MEANMKFLLHEGAENNSIIIKNVVTDILFIQYHTRDYVKVIDSKGNVYYSTQKLFELQLKLQEFNYELIARDTVANLTKIYNFEEETGRLYFTPELYVVAVRAAYGKIAHHYDYKSKKAEEKSKKKLGFGGVWT